MLHSKGKNFNTYNLTDIDSQSFDIVEPDLWARRQVTLSTIDLLGNLFLGTERELLLKYSPMQA